MSLGARRSHRPVGRSGVRIGHDGPVSIPDSGLDRGSLRERLADVIRQDIVNGVFGPGEQLRTETLVARYQVSQHAGPRGAEPAGERGLVELRTNRGARVALVTKADAVSLLEVAGMLNIAAYEAGVPRLTDEQIARAERPGRPGGGGRGRRATSPSRSRLPTRSTTSCSRRRQPGAHPDPRPAPAPGRPARAPALRHRRLGRAGRRRPHRRRHRPPGHRARPCEAGVATRPSTWCAAPGRPSWRPSLLRPRARSTSSEVLAAQLGAASAASVGARVSAAPARRPTVRARVRPFGDTRVDGEAECAQCANLGSGARLPPGHPSAPRVTVVGACPSGVGRRPAPAPDPPSEPGALGLHTHSAKCLISLLWRARFPASGTAFRVVTARLRSHAHAQDVDHPRLHRGSRRDRRPPAADRSRLGGARPSASVASGTVAAASVAPAVRGTLDHPAALHHHAGEGPGARASASR